MKRKLIPFAMTAVTAAFGLMGNAPVAHAGGAYVFTSDDLSELPIATPAQYAGTHCGKVLDPFTTQNDHAINFKWQDPAQAPNTPVGQIGGPGDYMDVSSVEVDTGLSLPSEAPNGITTNSQGDLTVQTNNIAGNNRSAQTSASASPNFGHSVPVFAAKLNLCGSLPKDNFLVPQSGFQGVSYSVYFQAPAQDNVSLAGFTNTGAPDYYGYYPSSEGYYYELSAQLSSGQLTYTTCVFDPILLSLCTTTPDMHNANVACNNTSLVPGQSSYDNPCIGGDTAEADPNPVSWFQINDVNGGTRNQIVMYMPYTWVLGTGTYDEYTILNPGDQISNIWEQGYGQYIVQVPNVAGQGGGDTYNIGAPGCNPSGTGLSGCLATATVPSWIISENFAVATNPGIEYCARVGGGLTGAANPNGCGSVGSVPANVGTTPCLGGFACAIPTPTAAEGRRSQLVDPWTYYPCGTQNAQNGGAPEAYPGQQGQNDGGYHFDSNPANGNAASPAYAALCNKTGGPAPTSNVSTDGGTPSCNPTLMRGRDTSASVCEQSDEGLGRPEFGAAGDPFNFYAPISGRTFLPDGPRTFPDGQNAIA
jgi:hypothetical protein